MIQWIHKYNCAKAFCRLLINTLTKRRKKENAKNVDVCGQGLAVQFVDNFVQIFLHMMIKWIHMYNCAKAFCILLSINTLTKRRKKANAQNLKCLNPHETFLAFFQSQSLSDGQTALFQETF